ncbi:MAG: DUF3149 domain-containing protein [Burkholderiaceae bacterium]|nr:DUF3149 domain-containing protein [Burkholderiaceae bacterium]
MHAWKELFSTDVGLLSVAAIAFMVGMAVYFVRFFLRHIREESQRQAQAAPRR